MAAAAALLTVAADEDERAEEMTLGEAVAIADGLVDDARIVVEVTLKVEEAEAPAMLDPILATSAPPTDIGVTVLFPFAALWYQGFPQASATFETCHPRALALGYTFLMT